MLTDHPLCDGDVAKFRADWTAVYYGQGTFFGPVDITSGASILPPNEELEVPSNVQLVLQNAFQAIYHTIRLDLGVIRPNQILTSSSMFDESISAVPLFQSFIAPNSTPPPYPVLAASTSFIVNNSYANTSRIGRSASDFNYYYQDALRFGPLDVRVPSVSYLRPVFRRKSTASAISSVFVATFAMVSAAWSLFHFTAGTFCKSQSDESGGCPHCSHNCRDPGGDSESVLLVSCCDSRHEEIAMGEMDHHK
ncbi:uncharacterized protein BT62DRAFT_548255 [Guyanagaster necrorhizus]|uniref:Uncharacterized protein n=1 Tax=Guyanagaster necrorhizus TaxID=856835 RepID=A0A9P8ANQ0_9AGAR|nr:uncharacterized protein BT62DRAFT_548255 [Guyanagaster necrorhizus MCA 3950]KAG7441082.1 hypothetical protein BT62DRAFT_548255 [Guyanagaster necrorhizus MCA 3950]